MAMLLSFEPLQNQVIKSLGREQLSDQGRFSLIKILDPICKCFYRHYISDYPWQ